MTVVFFLKIALAYVSHELIFKKRNYAFDERYVHKIHLVETGWASAVKDKSRRLYSMDRQHVTSRNRVKNHHNS